MMFFWGACLIEGGYAFLLASDCVIEIEQTFARLQTAIDKVSRQCKVSFCRKFDAFDIA